MLLPVQITARNQRVAYGFKSCYANALMPSPRHFECNDSINNVGSQGRVDFGGANQPKGSEERSRTC